MIDTVEALLQHWAEQSRRNGLGGGGVKCSLAELIQWQGPAPRMGRGSSVPAGLGIDAVAELVDRALASLMRQGAQEDAGLAKAWAAAGQAGRPPFCLHTQLYKLARVRYLTDPMPTVEQQCRRLKIAGVRTYHRRVDELHEWLQRELQSRNGCRAA